MRAASIAGMLLLVLCAPAYPLPAPSLPEGKALKGGPLAAFEPGKTYVVSFWSAPAAEREGAVVSLIELARFDPKNLEVVCITGGPETVAARALLEKSGDLNNLRVIALPPDRKRPDPGTEAWTSLVAQDVYPRTFIVDRSGEVAFGGDVLEAAEVIGDVVGGTLTGEMAQENRQRVAADLEKVRAEVQGNALQMQLRADNGAAVKVVDALLAKYPTLRSELLREKLFSLLRAERYEEAYAVADEAAHANRFNPNQLNEMAWFIVDEEWIAEPDLDRALKMSERSVELSAGQTGAFLDTLARVHFERGDLDKAIEIQSRALAVATPREREELQTAMARYRAALPR